MWVADGDFEQRYNGQTAVNTDTLLVVAQGLTLAGNDKQQVVPMLAELKALPASLGQVQAMLGDCGDNSESNIAACEVAEIEPYLAVAREDRHTGWRVRFEETTPLDVCGFRAHSGTHSTSIRTMIPGRSGHPARSAAGFRSVPSASFRSSGVVVERLSIRKIREVLRLKFECGLSTRKIARSLGVGHSSAGDYLCRFAASGLAWPTALSDAELERQLFPPALWCPASSGHYPTGP